MSKVALSALPKSLINPFNNWVENAAKQISANLAKPLKSINIKLTPHRKSALTECIVGVLGPILRKNLTKAQIERLVRNEDKGLVEALQNLKLQGNKLKALMKDFAEALLKALAKALAKSVSKALQNLLDDLKKVAGKIATFLDPQDTPLKEWLKDHPRVESLVKAVLNFLKDVAQNALAIVLAHIIMVGVFGVPLFPVA